MKIVKSAMILLGLAAATAVGCGETRKSGVEAEAGRSAAGEGTSGSKPGAGGTDVGGSRGGGDSAGAGAPPDDRFEPKCEPALQPDIGNINECSFAATCEQLACDDGFSRFGADGCLRFCESSIDCAAGQRCRFTLLSGQDCGASSVVEACTVEEDGSCFCSETSDCRLYDICVDAERFPESEDCAVTEASCKELNDLDFTIGEYSQDPGEAKQAAIEACWEAIAARRVELDCPI